MIRENTYWYYIYKFMKIGESIGSNIRNNLWSFLCDLVIRSFLLSLIFLMFLVMLRDYAVQKLKGLLQMILQVY